MLHTLFAGLLEARAPCVVVHGPPGSGKSHLVAACLGAATAAHATVQCSECVTPRVVLERLLSALSRLYDCPTPTLCDSFARFLSLLSAIATPAPVLLVLDRADQVMEPQPELLVQLATMHEQLPGTNITVVLVMSAPDPKGLLTRAIPHVYCPAFDRGKAIEVVTAMPHPQLDVPLSVWSLFVPLVVDSFVDVCGTNVVALHRVASTIFPRFVEPIVAGTAAPGDVVRLYRDSTHLFSDSVLSYRVVEPTETSLYSHLPVLTKYLLVASYLALFNAPTYDLLLFSKIKLVRAGRRFAGKKNRRGLKKLASINSQMLAASAFDMERMLAILHALYEPTEGKDVVNTTALMSALATLVSQRLVLRGQATNSTDQLTGKVRFKCGVPWDIARKLAGELLIELDGFMMDD